MLLTLLKWLRSNTDLDFEIALLRGGPLVEEYARLAHVHQTDAWGTRSLLGRRWGRRVDKFRFQLYRRRKAYWGDIGLIYANSLASAYLVRRLSVLNCPIICHVHEVGSYFRNTGQTELRKIAGLRPYFIAVTEGIRSGLEICVPREDTEVLPGFTSVSEGTAKGRPIGSDFRRRYGISESAFLIGGCGKPHWQKGHELFLLVAEELIREPARRPVHFVWLGGDAGDPVTEEFALEIQRRRLQSHFTLIHTIAETDAYFDSLDVFALTSRDDPLPLVVLEAGSHGLPVVCFTGNAQPVVDRETGLVVPYEDTHQFAQRVRELAADDDLRTKLGTHLRSKIMENHNVEVAAPHILNVIKSKLNRNWFA